MFRLPRNRADEMTGIRRLSSPLPKHYRRRILTERGQLVLIALACAGAILTTDCATRALVRSASAPEGQPWYLPRDGAERSILHELGAGDAGMLELCRHRGADANGNRCD
jgi:hypothetical protein